MVSGRGIRNGETEFYPLSGWAGTRFFTTSPARAPQTDQMIACRTRAETHSLTSTVAKMAIRITLTRVQASSLRAALSWRPIRSEEHTSELQSLRRISYAALCVKKKHTNK